MEMSKRIDGFIKHHVSRDVNTTRGNIQTFETLMHVTVAKKHTLLRSKLKFAIIVRPEVGPTCTPEGTKR